LFEQFKATLRSLYCVDQFVGQLIKIMIPPWAHRSRKHGLAKYPKLSRSDYSHDGICALLSDHIFTEYHYGKKQFRDA